MNAKAPARLKVVHLPSDLGMRAYSLSQAERALGLDSSMIVKSAGTHASGAAQPLHSPSRLVYLWRLLKAFVRSLRADVIMANSGSTLLDFPSARLDLLDVPLYRALGKKLIVTYQGCDVRPCESCPVRAFLPEGEKCVNVPARFDYAAFDDFKRRRLHIWSRHADAILGITPDLCRTERVRYSPHAKHFDPPSGIVQRPSARTNGILRIAHMPKPHIKGTVWIEEQIEQLRSRFVGRLEYVRIEGVSWQTALERLAACDVVVDQVLSGWYGGISVEAAMLGVLPIAYIDAELLRHVPEEMRNDLPVLALAAKEELPTVLEKLIGDAECLREEQRRCRASALRFHEATAVAQELLRQHYGESVPA